MVRFGRSLVPAMLRAPPLPPASVPGGTRAAWRAAVYSASEWPCSSTFSNGDGVGGGAKAAVDGVRPTALTAARAASPPLAAFARSSEASRRRRRAAGAAPSVSLAAGGGVGPTYPKGRASVPTRAPVGASTRVMATSCRGVACE
jgi:hypothetical protein